MRKYKQIEVQNDTNTLQFKKEPTQQRRLIQEINPKQLRKQDITKMAVLNTCTTHSLSTLR